MNFLPQIKDQKGIAQFLVIGLVLIGIAIAVLLSQNPQIFAPKAQEISQQILNDVSTYPNSSSSPASEKLMMVNYKFTNPGDSVVQARARLAVSDLKAKINLLSAYYGMKPNFHYTGQLVNYNPAKSPFDLQWSWTVEPSSVTASEITDPSCYWSPYDLESHVRRVSDNEKDTGTVYPEVKNNTVCFQSSSIESIEGINPMDSQKWCTDKKIGKACLNSDSRICLDFNSCLPDGWTAQKDGGVQPDPGAQLRDEQRIKDLKAIHDALLTYKKDHNSFCLKGNGKCNNASPLVQYMFDPKLGNNFSPDPIVESALFRYLYPMPADPLYASGQTVKLGDKEVPYPNYLVVMYNDNSFVLSARLETMKPENKNCVPQDAPLVNYCINQE